MYMSSEPESRLATRSCRTELRRLSRQRDRRDEQFIGETVGQLFERGGRAPVTVRLISSLPVIPFL